MVVGAGKPLVIIVVGSALVGPLVSRACFVYIPCNQVQLINSERYLYTVERIYPFSGISGSTVSEILPGSTGINKVGFRWKSSTTLELPGRAKH